MNRSRLHEVARIRVTKAESSTASDHRKVVAPKGRVKLTDRMREATRLVAEGLTCGDVATRYGVSKQTVSQWCQKVKWAQEDEAALRELRG